MAIEEVKKTLAYEAASSLNVLKQIDTWIFVSLLISVFALIAKSYGIVLVLIIIAFMLHMKRNYDSGVVTDYYRRKMGVPSPAQIKKWKEENVKE